MNNFDIVTTEPPHIINTYIIKLGCGVTCREGTCMDVRAIR